MKERKVLSLLLAFVMVLSLLPAGLVRADASGSSITAYVTMSYSGSIITKENKTLYAVPVTLESGKTAEDAVAAAVQDCGFTYERTSGYGVASAKDFSTYPSGTAANFGTYSGCSGTLGSAVFVNGVESSGASLSAALSAGDRVEVLLYDYGSDYSGTPAKRLFFAGEDGSFCAARTVHVGSNLPLNVYSNSYDSKKYCYGSGSAVTDANISYYTCSDNVYNVTATPFASTGTVYAIAAKAGYTPAVALLTVTDSSENAAPALRSGVSATTVASTYLTKPYTLSLPSVFYDADGDALTYTVSIGSAAAISANAQYTFTPTQAGTTTLVFTASDGKVNSDTYTVTLNASEHSSVESALNAMSSYYNTKLTSYAGDANDDWAVADMAANGRTVSAAVKQAVADHTVYSAPSMTKASDLARTVIVLKALGYDATKIGTNNNGTFFDVVAAMQTKSDYNSIYSQPYILIALQQFGTTYQTQIDALVSSILGQAKSNGGWNGYGDTIDADTTAPVLLALAPYYSSNADVKAAVDKALSKLDDLKDSTGAVASSWGYSACSTGVLLSGLAALGSDKVSGFTGGLLCYYDADSHFQVYSGDATSDEQGFRGLVAAKNASTSAFRIYDFSNNGSDSVTASCYNCPVLFSVIPASATITVAKADDSSVLAAKSAGSYDLAAGDYTYSVSKDGYTTKSGSFSVSTDDAAKHTAKSISVSLASAVSGSTGGSTITVNFTLVGDTAHGDGGTVHVYNKDGGAGRTWVTKTSFTVPAGSSVFDVFDQACAANGVDYLEKSEGYFYSLSKSGVTLSELTNGKNAGWLYLVNGASPLVTIRQYKLSDGDCIVFYYSDDYTLEKGSEMWGGGAALDNTVTVPVTDGSASTPVSAAVSGGTATVSASAAQLAAVAAQSGEDAKTLDLSAVGKSVTNAVVPAKLVAAVSGGDRSGSLALTLPTGTVTLDKAALAAAVATGKDISVSLSAVSPETLTAAQKRALGEKAGSAVVVSASILAGGEKLTDFGGGSITMTVPYTPKDGEDTACLTVWYLAEDGSITPMTGSYDAAAKTFSFTTPHLSSYVVVAFPFADVVAGSWYYGSAAYCYMNGLLAGTSAESFSPELTTSRAMLAAVLYRLAGSPAVTEKAAFTDVAAGSWYESAVSWAAKTGIVTGVDAARFDPDADVTREQAAAMLYRYAKFKGIDTTQGGMSVREFTDYASVSSYALEAVQWAVNAKLLQGSNSKLDPAASATRAQAAALLQRLAGISA